jgi:hypothetical protein
MECIYCNKEITKDNRSDEHIIHNALGGHLKSPEVCCSNCNALLKELIDDKFCKIFVPITSRMKNIKKTRTTNVPVCTGMALYLKDGQIYKVIIRGDDVVGCTEYEKKNKVNLTKADYKQFRIVLYDFKVENSALKQGIAKIAVNFAMYNKINPFALQCCFTKKANEKGDLTHIEFKCPIVVFLPCNELDMHVERCSRMDLFHSLILFSYENLLVCYVDLFNTFQYYVILSQMWDRSPVYESYCQMLIKFDRSIPDLHNSRAKDITIVAAQYNVEPTYNIRELELEIKKVIDKEPYKKCLANLVSDRVIGSLDHNLPLSIFGMRSFLYYFDDDDMVRLERYRIFTPVEDSNSVDSVFYPEICKDKYLKDRDAVKEYICMKMERLNEFIIGGAN